MIIAKTKEELDTKNYTKMLAYKNHNLIIFLKRQMVDSIYIGEINGNVT